MGGAVSYAARGAIMCASPAAYRGRVFSEEPPPERDAGFLSQVYFTWASGTVALGYERPLQPADLSAHTSARQKGCLTVRSSFQIKIAR